MIGNTSFKALRQNKEITALIAFSFLVLGVMLFITKHFLAFNETRIGFSLYDPIIESIGPYDLNKIIFIATYLSIILGLIGTMTSLHNILKINFTIIALLSLRIIAMYFVPLEPPNNIIPLEDWLLVHTTYGEDLLVRDLFFSGHTASVLLPFFLIKKKYFAYFFLVMSVVVGTMLIVQHVHYTVDVIGAFFFTFLASRIGLWCAQKSMNLFYSEAV